MSQWHNLHCQKCISVHNYAEHAVIKLMHVQLYNERYANIVKFLRRVRIARNADCCNSYGLSVRPTVCLSVCLSVLNIPVFCPYEWRYDCAGFSVA